MRDKNCQKLAHNYEKKTCITQHALYVLSEKYKKFLIYVSNLPGGNHVALEVYFVAWNQKYFYDKMDLRLFYFMCRFSKFHDQITIMTDIMGYCQRVNNSWNHKFQNTVSSALLKHLAWTFHQVLITIRSLDCIWMVDMTQEWKSPRSKNLPKVRPKKSRKILF